MNRWRAEIALILNTIIWGSTFVLVKNALADVSPLLFLALRFSLATFALLFLFRRRWSTPRKGGNALKAGLLAGVFLFGGYLFQTLGLRLTTAPKSAFLTGLSIAMVPLLSSAVYRIKPRLIELLGVALATSGLGLMTLERAGWGINPGDVLTVVCAVLFAAHIVTVGHYAGRISFEPLSLGQVATCAVLALAGLGWAETPVIQWNLGVLVAVAVTGLLATALAFTVQAWAQQYTTSTRTALIFALEPVFAWTTSFLLAGETLSRRAAAGAGLILAGILLVELKPFSLEHHPSE